MRRCVVRSKRSSCPNRQRHGVRKGAQWAPLLLGPGCRFAGSSAASECAAGAITVRAGRVRESVSLFRRALCIGTKCAPRTRSLIVLIPHWSRRACTCTVRFASLLPSAKAEKWPAISPPAYLLALYPSAATSKLPVTK
ncbi:hypothetical protein HYPSUDRAFT_663714 [Hypholoma sublateritium FD-334 SS-4]|uniref:Uncharacterized protein n=1 Tax=Hypholoma sublateritium (strain FD-334 SS-4) TaxID=945553 RepID=A0A0D2L5D3_HYPSF|nr:hypothetical protein HYPSUDRAFT_663714 [Hypholoma sublateritium FD-334 SS-4]